MMLTVHDLVGLLYWLSRAMIWTRLLYRFTDKKLTLRLRYFVL